MRPRSRASAAPPPAPLLAVRHPDAEPAASAARSARQREDLKNGDRNGAENNPNRPRSHPAGAGNCQAPPSRRQPKTCAAGLVNEN